MDPNETLRQMCATRDDDERRELGLALLDWLIKGGFPPDGYSVAAITGR